jgi:hypothetical protein
LPERRKDLRDSDRTRERRGGNCRYEILKTGKRVLGYSKGVAGQEKGYKGFVTFIKDLLENCQETSFFNKLILISSHEIIQFKRGGGVGYFQYPQVH